MLLAVAEKNEAAMAEIYSLTNHKLFGICLRICADRNAAEDVLHDAYERVWQRAGSWKPGVASPISWLAAIARNRSIDWCRKRRIVEAPLDDAWDIADESVAADVQVMQLQELQWCMSHLEMLDERYRDALKDTYLNGMTHLQIALRDDVPLSTVKSRTQRGLRKLQIEFATLQSG